MVVSTITTSLLDYMSQPRGLEIAFPGNLPSQATNALLTARPNQQPQSLSTAARLVRAPLLRIAWRLKRSSISMFVRMTLLMCKG